MQAPEPLGFSGRVEGAAALAARLRRLAARRWLLMAVALVLLGWLWFVAGHVRNPEGVKREWAVLVSRILGAGAAVFLARLILFPHEERVPVLFFDCRAVPMTAANLDPVLGLRRLGYDTIPLEDVTMLIRERRYVPKRCFALVMAISTLDDADRIAAYTGQMPVTLFIGSGDLEAAGRGSGGAGTGTGYGIRVVASRSENEEEIQSHLEEALEKAVSVVGTRPEYAMVEGGARPDLDAVAKATGLAGFLDGVGFNRYGDEPHLIRILDVTWMGGRRLLGTINLAAHIALFKGGHYALPVAAIATFLGGRPGGGR